MYMAPITKAVPQPAAPAIRLAVGVPVLAFAGLVMVPWMLAVGLVAAAMLLGRFGLQAIDYAGTVALGR